VSGPTLIQGAITVKNNSDHQIEVVFFDRFIDGSGSSTTRTIAPGQKASASRGYMKEEKGESNVEVIVGGNSFYNASIHERSMRDALPKRTLRFPSDFKKIQCDQRPSIINRRELGLEDPSKPLCPVGN